MELYKIVHRSLAKKKIVDRSITSDHIKINDTHET